MMHGLPGRGRWRLIGADLRNVVPRTGCRTAALYVATAPWQAKGGYSHRDLLPSEQQIGGCKADPHEDESSMEK